MTELSLEALGLTKDDLIERLVEKLAYGLLDEDGDDFSGAMRKAVQAAVNAKVDEIANTHVLPKVGEMIETMTFQKSNGWGEAKEPPKTYREYLIERAEHWLEDKVNYEGKAQGETYGGWSGTQTRLTYMVHQHLQYNIASALKTALSTVNSKIANGLAETVKMQLNDVLSKLKVDVKL